MKFSHIGLIVVFTTWLLIPCVLVLFDFTLNPDRSRLLYIIAQCKTCDTASALAESDFKKGQYLLIRWGLPETRSTVVGEVLLAEYGIKQIYGGCVKPSEVDCYTNRMAELLLGRYGAGFYEDVVDKANRIYEERKRNKP